MANVTPIGFNLIRIQDWMLKAFSIFATPGGRLTGIAIDHAVSSVPSSARIRNIFETFLSKVKDLPELVPFFVDKITNGSESTNFLFIYRKTSIHAGRHEYKLISCYSYRKNTYSTGTLPLDDLTFDILFFIGEKLVSQVPLKNIHKERFEHLSDLKKSIKMESKNMAKPVPSPRLPVTPAKKKIMSKATVARQAELEEQRKAQALADRANTAKVTETVSVVTEPSVINMKNDQVPVSKIQEVSNNGIEEDPQLLTIMMHVASLEMDQLTILRARIETIIVLKEAHSLLKIIRESDLPKDHILKNQAVLLGQMVQKETLLIEEIKKMISILEALTK